MRPSSARPLESADVKRCWDGFFLAQGWVHSDFSYLTLTRFVANNFTNVANPKKAFMPCLHVQHFHSNRNNVIIFERNEGHIYDVIEMSLFGVYRDTYLVYGAFLTEWKFDRFSANHVTHWHDVLSCSQNDVTHGDVHSVWRH